ncbi:hypothetical protein [Mycobacterium sp. GA-1199]|uniref:hypothetical protein n=1 Tax=Mycobacterium sp. GA-1199 TaxID=1772287 RepID=UPI000AEF0DE3|nr:hypothetical protein [Mycobacterium sp. GA-1199]
MTAEPVVSRDPMQPADSREVRTAFQSGGVQCTARSKRTGNRCQRPAMLGGNVCRAHGGNAPQTRAKARQRLEQAADALVQRLLGMALDGDVADPVALAAIRDALDRAGLNPKTAVEVEVGPTPVFQQLFTGIDRSIRRDSTRVTEQPAPAPPAPEIVDAEVVDMPSAGAVRPRTPTAPGNPGDDPKRPPPWQGEPLPDYTPKRPGNQLMTLEEANKSLAAECRRG